MKRDDDNGYLREALPAFVSEASEHLQQLEELLLQIEDDPHNRDLLDALFRCAHTIKGSAGIFGLDRIVQFTHHVETLLERLRRGERAFDPDLGTLLLRCADHTRLLLEHCASDTAIDDEAAGTGGALVAALREACGLPASVGDAAPPTPAATPAPTDAGAPVDAPAPADAAAPVDAPAAAAAAAPRDAATPTDDAWCVRVSFGADTFRNGMDPLAIISYLQGLGTVHAVQCAHARIPALEELDPECCHLVLEVRLTCPGGSAAIETAFSFVREDCDLSIERIAAPVVSQAAVDAAGRAAAGPTGCAAGAGATSADAAIAPTPSAPGDTTPEGSTLATAGGTAAGPGGKGTAPDATAADPGGKGTAPDGAAAGPGGGVSVPDGRGDGRPATGGDAAPRWIRVRADRLDNLIDLLGELVISSASASLIARESRHSALIEANAQVSGLVEEIRDGTLQLRMVPIGDTFARFRRVVRDTAAELGKDIHLALVGTDTEMDKSVVERIVDPLMHLVRNALDHGLETPQERRAAGKSPQGRLTLEASHESGSIVIRIRDDGRGIDRDRVLARARERGLVGTEAQLSDAEIVNLIFQPGFSTAHAVTNLSGRGVGMDVVRSNIEALRGTVAITSEAGHGACIEIRLPLTLAIIDGFLVGIGDSRFIFPLDSVIEVVEGGAAVLSGGDDCRCVTELRGQLLPVLDLRRLYEIESPAPPRRSIVVLRVGLQRIGVIVDSLHGQHQTVIKPLASIFRGLRGISGSTILGNGEVALIFDVASLADIATSSFEPSATNASRESA